MQLTAKQRPQDSVVDAAVDRKGDERTGINDALRQSGLVRHVTQEP